MIPFSLAGFYFRIFYIIFDFAKCKKLEESRRKAGRSFEKIFKFSLQEDAIPSRLHHRKETWQRGPESHFFDCNISILYQKSFYCTQLGQPWRKGIKW